MKVAVVGASGFVGTAVTEVLRGQGHGVYAVRAPRVPNSAASNALAICSLPIDDLVREFVGMDTVIICSGNPDASERDVTLLWAANASSPALVARAAHRADVGRLIYVSSAVVQGRRATLDETNSTEEFSAYASSKAEGERLVHAEYPSAVVYRPPSVHGVDRRVTRLTARLAASRIACVAKPGNQASPQALIGNVASAISFLATSPESPPQIVIHPWEGLSVSDVMELLGGRQPCALPRNFALFVCRALSSFSGRVPRLAANSRRLEMLWLGQGQADSWLTRAGWTPPLGREAWRQLGEEVRMRQLEVG